jgi:hypothetical protein
MIFSTKICYFFDDILLWGFLWLVVAVRRGAGPTTGNRAGEISDLEMRLGGFAREGLIAG